MILKEYEKNRINLKGKDLENPISNSSKKYRLLEGGLND